jgi:hypothetical protein
MGRLWSDARACSLTNNNKENFDHFTQITGSRGVGLALTNRNLKIFVGQKFNTCCDPYFRPRSIHACQRMPNQSHDTVLSKIYISQTKEKTSERQFVFE